MSDLRIVAAAVRRLDPNKAWTPNDDEPDVNWMTYTMPRPARHHNILHTMPGDALNVEQGFLTSDGQFVGRAEGMRIARSAGQTDSDRQTLFSEDLW